MEEEAARVRIADGADKEYKQQGSKTSMKKSLLKPIRRLEPTTEETEQDTKSTEYENEIETTRIQTIIEVLDEELFSSDSDVSLMMKPDYLEQAELEESLDFFEKLGSIPAIADFEEKESIIKAVTKVAKLTERKEGQDIGSFVDPLTGEQLPPSVQEEEEEEEEMSVEEESSSSGDLEITEDDELLELLKADQRVEIPKVLDEAEVFETFLEMEKGSIVVDTEEFDWVALERERERQKIAADADVFLKELIAHVVEKCEYIDPKVLLRQNLNKAALIEQISKKLDQLELEQKTRTFLSRRVAEFHYRKGRYRVFADDAPETINAEINKFKDATKKLDHILAREEEVRRISEEKMANLREEEWFMQEKNHEKLQELEQLVRKTFAYPGERLVTVVDSELQVMAKVRDEISKVRLVMIENQHSNAKMTEKLKQLEDIGNNLLLREYESMQNEVQALGKKIEERNVDLNKSRMRCNADLHKMGHLKEKQAMLRDKIRIQKSMMGLLDEQKKSARENIYNSKTERNVVRKEIKELRYQSGLLDKPALMMDYDNTVVQLKKVGKAVEKLRDKQEDLQRKIAKLESKCL
ncbi:coiled-coil domain-containing protein 96-like [Anastrepha ludens]|uniref:coiled-coil domain-containing protein 96-like n=1 Tax=Anastrepha ludens TaxID=28586 RepID=UPI0023B0D958|nr:coiled-coil domain-containing protein 96-like [Anastrepha ludens]